MESLSVCLTEGRQTDLSSTSQINLYFEIFYLFKLTLLKCNGWQLSGYLVGIHKVFP